MGAGPLAPGDRVDALVADMSIPEKVAQLSCAGRAYELAELFDDEGALRRDVVVERFPHGIGQLGRISVGRDPALARRAAQEIQECLARSTRLGIGALLNEEGVHGLMGVGSTVFPAALALAATWDVALVEDVYTAVAHETRRRGSNYVYAPVLDLARDPRWGRVEETFGEDPHLVARMGVAAVRGLQGASVGPIDRHRVLACAKHFVGHGVPQAGSNAGPVQLGERELREEHLEPFARVIREAGVGAVMAAYHERDGIPVHVDSWLLGEVLRDELGFDGMVTSDGFGIPQLASVHGVAADPVDAARRSIAAGVDCEVPEPVGTPGLAALAARGEIDVAPIDRAVRHVLAAKDRLGLLDGAVGSSDGGEATDRSTIERHARLALDAARRGLVLLTNQGLLPLDASRVTSLLVTGPNAAHAHLGGYTDPGAVGVGVLAGLGERFGDSGVRFEEGCRITDEPAGPATWWADEVTLADPALDDERIERAVDAAAAADVAVVVVGGNEATHREGWWHDHLGDRADLTLVGRQDELVERVAATGTPTVAVVISGGPVDLSRVVDAADAVLWTCYPGQDGGTAIAEVLAGDHEPGGRLPVTFPRAAGQIPLHTSRRRSAGRGYLHGPAEPLFWFGDGLGYTTFETVVTAIGPLRIGLRELAAGATIDVAVRVANVGDRFGSELVRLCVDDPLASVARPRHRLRAFRRVELPAGGERELVMSLDADDLALVDRTMTRRVEPGAFEITVRTSAMSADGSACRSVGTVVVTDDGAGADAAAGAPRRGQG